MLNGRLILVSADIKPTEGPDIDAPVEVKMDTLDFVYMDNDSLIMTQNGVRIGFHRKESAMEANKEANKAQAKIDSIKKQER